MVIWTSFVYATNASWSQLSIQQWYAACVIRWFGQNSYIICIGRSNWEMRENKDGSGDENRKILSRFIVNNNTNNKHNKIFIYIYWSKTELSIARFFKGKILDLINFQNLYTSSLSRKTALAKKEIDFFVRHIDHVVWIVRPQCISTHWPKTGSFCLRFQAQWPQNQSHNSA